MTEFVQSFVGTKPPHGRFVTMLAIAILFMGTFLRTVSLGQLPLPLHQDELSDIYDGYSLATTGADRWGEPWPILMRGMGPGDYHPPMYAYLALVSSWLGGFSVVAGRLPGAIAGVVTLWLVYVAACRLLGRAGGYLALVFATFSPILIQYSRQAHPGTCLPPLFAILIVVLLVKCIEPLGAAPWYGPSRRVNNLHPIASKMTTYGTLWVAAAGLAVGLSTNAYASLRLTALLLAGVGAGLLHWEFGIRRRDRKGTLVALILFTATVGIGASPQIYAMIAHPEHFFARAWATFYSWDNGPRWWIETLAKNLTVNLEPNYLFLSFGTYRAMSVARLSAVALPFFYVGLVTLLVSAVRRRGPIGALLPSAIGFTLLPAIATHVQPSPMRSSGVWALYPIVCALGAVTLAKASRWCTESVFPPSGDHATTGTIAYRRVARAAAIALGVIVAALGLFDVYRYLRRTDLHGVVAQNQFVHIGEWLKVHEKNYDRIYIDADGHFGYLFVTAFSGMSPTEFQAAPRDGTVTADGWEQYTRFGRFYFKTLDQANADWLASERNERWIVLGEQGAVAEFMPQQEVVAHDTISEVSDGCSKSPSEPSGSSTAEQLTARWMVTN
ncbi:MAG: glycosyltransferase family 39 protein [Planctomycetota bacterium]